MERAELWRRAERGAAVATAVLAIAAGLIVLFAPLVAYCAVPLAHGACPAGALRTESLRSASTGGDVWAYLVAMLLVLLIGAGGAARDAARAWRPGAAFVAVAAVLALVGFVVGAGTVLGLIFLPPVLGVVFASFAAVMRRRAARVGTSGAEARSQAEVMS